MVGMLGSASERVAAVTARKQGLLKPPDLQKLVTQYGRYNRITPEAWQAWDQVGTVS
jgi:hypothetical protein